MTNKLSNQSASRLDSIISTTQEEIKRGKHIDELLMPTIDLSTVIQRSKLDAKNTDGSDLYLYLTHTEHISPPKIKYHSFDFYYINKDGFVVGLIPANIGFQDEKLLRMYGRPITMKDKNNLQLGKIMLAEVTHQVFAERALNGFDILNFGDERKTKIECITVTSTSKKTTEIIDSCGFVNTDGNRWNLKEINYLDHNLHVEPIELEK